MQFQNTAEQWYRLYFDGKEAHLTVTGGNEKCFKLTNCSQEELMYLLEVVGRRDNYWPLEICDVFCLMEQCNEHSFATFSGNAETIDEIIPETKSKVTIGFIEVADDLGLYDMQDVYQKIGKKSLIESDIIFGGRIRDDLEAKHCIVYLFR